MDWIILIGETLCFTTLVTITDMRIRYNVLSFEMKGMKTSPEFKSQR